MTLMGLQYLEHVETKRANAAREAISLKEFGETQRSNLAKERISQGNLDELVRSNIRKEGLTAQQLAEIARSNKAHESIEYAGLSETVRSNKVREGQNLQALAETKRTNMAKEGIQQGNLNQLISYQTGSLKEQTRSNKAKEENVKYQTNLNALKNSPWTSTIVAQNQLVKSGYLSDKQTNGTEINSAMNELLNELSRLSPFAFLAK